MRAKTKAQAKLRDKKTVRPKTHNPTGKPANKKVAKCPDCGVTIGFSQSVWINQPVICPSCDSDLTIVAIKPIRLDYAD